MYTPKFNAMSGQTARSFVGEIGSGWLVTNSSNGPPAATLMPVLWENDIVIAHMAKANSHWRTITDGAPGLFIVSGPEAYISPSWYAAKTEHGRVVPTWNYLAVHLAGTVHTVHDPDWLLNAVTALTNRHEQQRSEPWHVDDAPDEYIKNRLKAIVGIELHVDHVDGKAKLSQNLSARDQAGVIDGLANEAPNPAVTSVASAMARVESDT